MNRVLGMFRVCFFAACAAALIGQPTVFGQVTPGAPAGKSGQATRLSAAELEKLVGPIALYPDDLLAILLPSSTTPLDVVKAQRFLEKRKSNPKLQPDPSLPEPVRNLLNYPEVVKKMNDDLDWTQRLGEAVVGQQKDVMNAIQAFRRRVYSVGNLKTDDKQIVVVEKEVIQIVPANPQVIYVPQYQPSTVVVVSSPPVYYATPYPVYYYSYPPGATFATGFFFGATTAYAFNWGYGSINYENASQLQAQRYQYASQLQSNAQQAAGERQTQRQEATGERQSQRQEAIGGTQTQRSETQSQRQQAASGAQGQSWSSDRQSAQLASAQAGTRPGDAAGGRAQTQAAGGFERGGGGGGGAFGGMGSGGDAQRASARGAESRGGMGSAGGARGGGRRR